MEEDIAQIGIVDLCHRVRSSIEKIKDKTLLLKSFPQGCCRDASLILSMILENYGVSDYVYCSKNIKDNSPSHAWLEYKGYILDLTADQFGSTYLSVIVKKDTNRDIIHLKDRQEKANLGIAGFDAAALVTDYRMVLEQLVRYDVKNYPD